ncbi:bifunctional 4-hydroxy-2-oxoglutarate aldolase/2-dehydro-3-deoxy-phosphogluconate aldolase [Lactobacillus sp. UCMA15818]|uniref:bifunctional 4-hydroxy-2-oxoglutarate aldolase/2-dehydro-3-deoxy-phosphogluconate aldolase n=1 Tax=Lactobacillus sp. UCMA15818 TaxID=2583394 RepID=UPI0025B26998|nr:bifunctional 4-hydroxy-2-oxoglutarate aldolase/2-dehydro-3-deoxy-phosphogluconate aldolase [Lactobacillus sp. UCMA15818]MDN2454130.1 bifunctional 4-hydroxy-2-oxoglutarate aldolase/2-dehydro-3-deoxy-phosphogluconate aldolase [Lactobacillus sp. UCMA15818]
MLKKIVTTQKIKKSGVIAVIRAKSAKKAVDISEAVIAGGLTGIEITFTVPQADQVITELSSKYQDTDVVIGAGTVLDSVSARLAILAGAQFIVSPSFDSSVAEICNLYQIPYTPGCQTLTEMQTALKAGVDIIKLFPGAIAGPQMVKAALAPLPQLNLMPTGGVNLENMTDWFKAGVIAVGAGSNLLKPAENGDLAGVTATAKKYMEKLNQIRN